MPACLQVFRISRIALRYAPSFFTLRFWVGLNISWGLLGNASSEVTTSAKDVSKHIVDNSVEVLALEAELTNHSRPFLKVVDGPIAPAKLSLACIVAYVA